MLLNLMYVTTKPCLDSVSALLSMIINILHLQNVNIFTGVRFQIEMYWYGYRNML